MDFIGKNGLLKQLTKALLERAMHAELTEHVGYEKHDPTGNNSGNSRNGTSKKKLKGEFGEIDLETRETETGVSNRRSSRAKIKSRLCTTPTMRTKRRAEIFPPREIWNLGAQD